MGNLVTEKFVGNGTWTCPAGVTSVNVSAVKNNFSDVYAFAQSVVVRDQKGSLFAWGTNTFGQLGLGDVTPRSSPVAVLGGLTFASNRHYNAISSGLTPLGVAYTWGQNSPNGQLGLGDLIPRSSPVAVLGGLTFSKFYNSQGQVWALDLQGKAYAFGSNTNGELGVGDVTSRSSPVAVLGGLSFQEIYVETSTGQNIAALAINGQAYGWGRNIFGELGVGDVIPRSSPVAVLGGLTFQKLYRDGVESVIGMTSSGALFAWGYNFAGHLGVGDVVARSSPVAVLGGLVFDPENIRFNGAKCLALTKKGKAYAWGTNGSGALGVGDVASRSSPVAVLGGLTFVKIYMASFDSAYGLTSSGQLYAWGSNGNGQLGVGNTVSRSSPVAVLGGLTFTDFFCDEVNASVYAISAQGQLYAWGLNTNGQLGVGDVLPRSSPVAVLGNLTLKMAPTITHSTLAVEPGVTYTLNFKKYNAFFGPYTIAENTCDLVTISYMQ